MQLPAKNSRILVIRLSSFGDVLLTTPLLRELKARDASYQIDFLVRKPFHQMVEENPAINSLVFYDKNDQSHKRDLKKNAYDLVIDLQNNRRSNRLKSSITHDKWTSYNKERIARFFYMKFGGKGFNNPIKSVQARYAESVGITLSSERPHFAIAKTGLDELPNIEGKFLCIAPGAAHATKQWPVLNFISLLKEMPDTQIVLLGGAAEAATAAEIEAEISCINLVGKTSFNQTAELLRRAEGLVCNDSSIMHLAYALSCKTLVFFGSTTRQFGFAPNASDVRIMENAELSCRPCTHIGRASCPKKHFKCMVSLTPQTALSQLKQLIGAA